MFLILLSIISIIVALIRKGSFANIVGNGTKAWYLFVISILAFLSIKAGDAMQISFIQNYAKFIIFAAYIFLIVGTVFNLNNLWMFPVLIGAILNLVVIFVNGGKLPITTSALAAANIAVETIKASSSACLATSSTSLIYLAGIIPIPLPSILAEVVTPGTLVIGLGLFFIIQNIFLGIVYEYEYEEGDDDEFDEEGDLSFADDEEDKKPRKNKKEKKRKKDKFEEDYDYDDYDSYEDNGKFVREKADNYDDSDYEEDEKNYADEDISIDEIQKTSDEAIVETLFEDEKPESQDIYAAEDSGISEINKKTDEIDFLNFDLDDVSASEPEETVVAASEDELVSKPAESEPAFEYEEENVLDEPIIQGMIEEAYDPDADEKSVSFENVQEPQDDIKESEVDFSADFDIGDDIIDEDIPGDEIEEQPKVTQEEVIGEVQKENVLPELTEDLLGGDILGSLEGEAFSIDGFDLFGDEGIEDAGLTEETVATADKKGIDEKPILTEDIPNIDYTQNATEDIPAEEENIPESVEEKEEVIDVDSPFVIIDGRFVENPNYKFRKGTSNERSQPVSSEATQPDDSKKTGFAKPVEHKQTVSPIEQLKEEITVEPSAGEYEKVEMKIGDVQIKFWKKDKE